MLIIILIHELGHLIALKYYNRKTDNLILFPFGGIIKYDDTLNKCLKEDFIISIMGIIFNLLLIPILKIINNNYLYNYNLIVLYINLLPILPLDGGRIILILMHKILSYRKCLKIMNYISIIEIFLLYFIAIIFIRKINVLFILTFLLINDLKEIRGINYKGLAFILNKYLYPNLSLKKKKIKGNVFNFFKGRNNYRLQDNKEIDEKAILKEFFEKQN